MADINLLHPLARQKALALQALCKQKGINIIISQTWRSKTEQDNLYAQGRTKPGKKITNAKYPFSAHCWGIGFDVAVWNDKDKDGKVDPGEIDWSAEPYNTVGKLGKTLNLLWGGDFNSIKDRPHFQIPDYDEHELIKKYSVPDNFKKTWLTIEKKQEMIKQVFNDIKGHWAEKYIIRANSEGIVSDAKDNKFNPELNITRAEVISLLMRLEDRLLAQVKKEG